MTSLALAALLAAASPTPPPSPPTRQPNAPEEPPRILQPVMRVLPRGLLLRLPIIDTDPNRGLTIGLMPIWVLESAGHDIRYIHAPSVDYNKTFGVTATYRYFFYPKPDATLNLRGSISQTVNRELYAKYDDLSLAGSRFSVGLLAHWDRDGSYRFFGIGPSSPHSSQTNYTGDPLGYRFHVGYPVIGLLRFNVGQRLQGWRVTDGPIKSLPGISGLFPEQVANRRHQDLAHRAFLSYDSRDNADTTTRGAFVETGGETSQRRLSGEHTYQRYLVDARGFVKTPVAHRQVTGFRLYFEQMTGDDVPFWLEPQLGGKYSLRSYGEGRYVDRGLLLVSLEHRVLVYRQRIAGVWAELEAAPFVEAGTVFPTPRVMTSRTLRPAYGAAFRAVARPQIVGSVDLGWGQEGMAAFVDINYSF